MLIHGSLDEGEDFMLAIIVTVMFKTFCLRG
jgi:hypothetical protein